MRTHERELLIATAGSVLLGYGLISLGAHELMVLAGVLFPFLLVLGWWIAGWVCDAVDPPPDTMQDDDSLGV